MYRFKGQPYDSAEIGERLQVRALLEGTVRRAGNRLRITTQLINAADGFEIWSERYDAEMKDVFDVQDEISRAMVGALSSELLGESAEPIVRQSTENPEAYRLYLQGNRWHDLSEAGLRQNIEYLGQALAIDPDFPQARAALARMLSLLSALGFERPADTRERARREALQALRSDETVAEAHIALAAILFDYDWDFAGAERSLRRAVQLNPANPDARQSLGTLLASQGRFAEALAELRLALQLDPLSARGNLLLCHVLNYSGDFEAALIQAKRTLEIDPRSHFAHVHMAGAYLGLRRPTAALQAMESALTQGPTPGILGHLGMAQAAVGREADARATIGKLTQARADGYSPALPVAEVYVALGELDQAFTWLGRAIEQREPLLTQLKHFPVRHDALKGDPRYAVALQRMGFPG